MSPITHLLASWTVANSVALDRRDRLLVALAGVFPDADGLGVVMDLVRRNAADSYEYYQKFHHFLFHNLIFGMSLAVAACVLAVNRRVAACLVFLSFHLHLLGDIVGSRGREGDYWGFRYLAPLSSQEVVWRGQWPLNGWQNIVITVGLLLLTVFLAWKRGYSVIELISARADAAFVDALRNRFGMPK